MSAQTKELEALIDQIPSEKGKISAMIMALLQGKSNNPEFIERAYLSYNEYDDDSALAATDLAEKLGDFKRIITLFEGVGRFGQAAWYAEKIGDNDNANRLYHRELEKLEILADFRDAGYLASKLGYKKRAIRNFVKGRWYDEAVKYALEMGDVDTAIQIHEFARKFEEGIKLALEKGKPHTAQQLEDKAIDYYRRRGLGLHLAKLLEKRGQFVEAMDLYEQRGWFLHASRTALLAGLPERAELYKKFGEILRYPGTNGV